MQDYQQRVVEEREALAEKLQKLTAFIVSGKFSELDAAERTRLLWQQSAMNSYRAALAQRIAAFES